MDMAREDLLEVRKLIAEKGMEMTPDELLATLNEVEDVEVVDEPGLVTVRREAKEWGEGDGQDPEANT